MTPVLIYLTGSVQIGKTRWLENLVRALAAQGVAVAGVTAPGIWRRAELGSPHTDAQGFEKLGIENVLLPQGEHVRLALRRDIALQKGLVEPDGQSERAGLCWAMTDGALELVNRHFSWLAEDDGHGLEDAGAKTGPRTGLLVVDELGRLELMRDEGLVAAMRLLERGPRPGWPHAIAVVRSDLLLLAHERLDAAWGGDVREVTPGPEAARLIQGLYLH